MSEEFSGNFSNLISTGCTLLDLAISGGKTKNGGIPSGIMVEIYGPAGGGKTVLLTEIAGYIQRAGGKVRYEDPEARLDETFAKMFDLDTLGDFEYDQPDTVSELFDSLTQWEPEPEKGVVHGIFADSLAALSTDLEMEKGDKMGMRRAKEFSEGCRKFARILKQKDFLMVCSNQVRTGEMGQDVTPGGKAIGFYASLRIRLKKVEKLFQEKTFKAGKAKKIKKVIGWVS